MVYNFDCLKRILKCPYSVNSVQDGKDKNKVSDSNNVF